MRYATNGRGVRLWAGRRSSLRAAGMGNLEFDDLLLDVSRVGHDGSAAWLAARCAWDLWVEMILLPGGERYNARRLTKSRC